MARTVVNPPEPPDPKAAVNKKKVAPAPVEEPRRTRMIDGVKYVLVNGGWRRDVARTEDDKSEGKS